MTMLAALKKCRADLCYLSNLKNSPVPASRLTRDGYLKSLRLVDAAIEEEKLAAAKAEPAKDLAATLRRIAETIEKDTIFGALHLAQQARAALKRAGMET